MPGVYRWTDKERLGLGPTGKTPFGVTRWPADSVDAAQGAVDKRVAVGEQYRRRSEQGDSDPVRRRSTPSVSMSWVRKEKELNEGEQRIWDQQQKNSTASRSTDKE